MTYISLLRGINVAGKNKIKMAQLKEMYLALGFTDVITYIQSGNVIFKAKESTTKALSHKITKAILETFGLKVPLLVFTHQDFDSILNNFPFDINPTENASTIAVTLLDDIPQSEDIETLMGYVHTPDALLVIKNYIYLSIPNGFGKTKLTNAFIEKKLKTTATTRNWKTMTYLYEHS